MKLQASLTCIRFAVRQGGPSASSTPQNGEPALACTALVSPAGAHPANLAEKIPIMVPATKSITITQRDTGPAAYRLHGQKGGKKLQSFERAPSANDIQLNRRTQPATASTMAAFSIRGRASRLAEVMAIGRITAQMTSPTMSQSITHIGRGSGV